MTLCSILGLNVTMPLGISTGHSDQYGPQRPAWSQVVTQMLGFHLVFSGNMDIHTDPGYCGTTDPDKALGRSPA